MAALVDKTTGLLYQIKRPDPETRKYSVNFSKFLTALAGVTSVTAQPRGLVTEVAPLTVAEQAVAGTILTFRLSGGTPNEDYEIKMVVTDSNGNTISEDVMIKVRIAGVVA